MAKITEKIKKFDTHPIPRSTGSIRPGNVLSFYYNTNIRFLFFRFDHHMALVVKNQRTSTGIFTSTKYNRLVSCFRLDVKSNSIIELILDALYKRRKIRRSLAKASTAGLHENTYRGLRAILGKESYRTYKLGQMQQLKKINPDG